jgi:hypothetical protein
LNVRKTLLRFPVIGPWVERRWMPDPVERDTHREVVRARLDGPVSTKPLAEPKQLTGGAPED